MKNALTICALIFATTLTFSQEKSDEFGFSKGDKLVTGNFGFQTNSYNYYINKNRSFGVSSSAGYFVNNNIVVGLGLGYGTQNTIYTLNNDLVKLNSFSGQIFGRYYFTPLKQFSFFTQLSVNASTANQELNQGSMVFNNMGRQNSFGTVAGLGINYFLNKNFSIESSVGALSYFSSKYDNPSIERESGFNLNLSMSDIRFGLNYRF